MSNIDQSAPKWKRISLSLSCISIHSIETESMLTEVPLASGGGVAVSIGVAITVRSISDPLCSQGLCWRFHHLHIASEIKNPPLPFRIQNWQFSAAQVGTPRHYIRQVDHLLRKCLISRYKIHTAHLYPIRSCGDFLRISDSHLFCHNRRPCCISWCLRDREWPADYKSRCRTALACDMMIGKCVCYILWG